MRLARSSPLESQEPMLNISAQSNQAIQSYWPSSASFEFGHEWE